MTKMRVADQAPSPRPKPTTQVSLACKPFWNGIKITGNLAAGHLTQVRGSQGLRRRPRPGVCTGRGGGGQGLPGLSRPACFSLLRVCTTIVGVQGREGSPAPQAPNRRLSLRGTVSPTPAGMSFASRLQAFWNHPAGPKTIHFWAPTFKWGISLANIADFSRPAELVSYPQQTAVTATGLIWSRFATQITPVRAAAAAGDGSGGLPVGGWGVIGWSKARTRGITSPHTVRVRSGPVGRPG